MPYLVRTSIHLSATCADLDEIAEAHAALKALENDLYAGLGKRFIVTVEKATLKGLRARETEAAADERNAGQNQTIPDVVATGAGWLGPPTLTPAELAELEVPERLRREGRKL